ncbi:MAG: L-2-amino-thiazoline-4-carboxylic acid hydrolase [Candidatus Nanopelagicales bacterium]
MLSGPARSVLFRLGRSTLDSTLAGSGLTEPGLAEEARDVYDRLAHRVPWPDQLANRFHLVFNVLPVAALCTALRERGWTAQDAVDVVQAASAARAFNMTRCYALDTFRDLDAAPAARVMCASEQLLAEASPLVRFSREGTLAAGAGHCDFRYELLDSHDRARASA